MFIAWSLGGILLLGAILDAVSNALNLLTISIAATCTAIIVVTWLSIEVIARVYGVSWKAFGGQPVLLRRIGPRIRFAVLGMLILLWMPTLVGFFHAKATDELHVEVGPYEDRIRIEEGGGYGNHSAPPITVAFPVKLVNASDRNIAITEYQITQLNCDFTDPFDDTEAVRGFFADPDGRNPVLLPISLPAGSGLGVWLRLGVASWSAASAQHGDSNTVRQLRLLLARDDSTDLFGNSVELSIGVRGWASIELTQSDTIFEPVYELAFTTSRRSIVRTVFAPYPEYIDKLDLRTCDPVPFARESPLMIDVLDSTG